MAVEGVKQKERLGCNFLPIGVPFKKDDPEVSTPSVFLRKSRKRMGGVRTERIKKRGKASKIA